MSPKSSTGSPLLSWWRLLPAPQDIEVFHERYKPFFGFFQRYRSACFLLEVGLSSQNILTMGFIVGFLSHSVSNPCEVNFRVRAFSVTVRITFSEAPSGISAWISRVTWTFALGRVLR